jgi:hypothetical protein
MNRLGSSVGIRWEVNPPFVIHASDKKRKPWVTNPRQRITFEECIFKIVQGKSEFRTGELKLAGNK